MIIFRGPDDTTLGAIFLLPHRFDDLQTEKTPSGKTSDFLRRDAFKVMAFVNVYSSFARLCYDEPEIAPESSHCGSNRTAYPIDTLRHVAVGRASFTVTGVYSGHFIPLHSPHAREGKRRVYKLVQYFVELIPTKELVAWGSCEKNLTSYRTLRVEGANLPHVEYVISYLNVAHYKCTDLDRELVYFAAFPPIFALYSVGR